MLKYKATMMQQFEVEIEAKTKVEAQKLAIDKLTLSPDKYVVDQKIHVKRIRSKIITTSNGIN